MRLAKPLMLACLVTIGATMLLTLLPYLSETAKNGAGEVAVFHVEPINRLSNSNMVDVLLAARLHEQLDHVDWNGGVLSVSIKVRPGAGRPASWFDDIGKLVRLSFQQLDNVKRLLVRIVEEPAGDGARLLAAADVRNTDSWLQHDLASLGSADPVHDMQWRERLRISFTAAWEERFGHISGYTARPAAFGSEDR
jgi:hypothetical protein